MASVETRQSWIAASTALVAVAITYGAPLVTVVALKPIAAELGSARSVPALAYSLAWLGAAVGGIPMGRIADRIGVRWTVAFGAVMIGIGLVISAGGSAWQLWVGHGLFIGLLGNAGINAPLYVYVSHWFDRRRGTALALIASGQHVAGVIWPTLFERGIALLGWQQTMIYFAILEAITVVPLALLVLRPPPKVAPFGGLVREPRPGGRVLGLSPNLALGLLGTAALVGCVATGMPLGHIVAFCSDLDIASSHGAAMLSVLLACAFVSRQFWGFVSDRIGGLRTVLIGSLCQLASMVCFLLVRNEAGLFGVAMLFGFGFSGMVPACVLAIRELFPASEAAWRVPTLLLFSGSGIAAGGWLAGALYDYAGFYGAAFGAGIAFNLANLIIVGSLVLRQRHQQRRVLAEPIKHW